MPSSGRLVGLVVSAFAVGIVLTILSSWLPTHSYDAAKQEVWIGWPFTHTRLHVYYDTIPMGVSSTTMKYVELGSPPLFGNVIGTILDVIAYASIFILLWLFYTRKRKWGQR